VIKRVRRVSLIPLTKQKTIAIGVDGIGKAVFPAPGYVFDRIDTKTIDAVLLKELRRCFQVSVNGGMFLI
jgi:hypothetical protein